MTLTYWLYQSMPAVAVTGSAYAFRDGAWQVIEIQHLIRVGTGLTEAQFTDTFGELPPSPLHKWADRRPG